MAEIVNFPKKHRVNHRRVYTEVKANDRAMQQRIEIEDDEPKRGVGGWILSGVRLLVYLLLYWVRIPVVLVCNLIAAPAFIAWLFALVAFPEGEQYSHVKWGFAVISFTAFVLKYGFDWVLTLLSPDEIMRTL